MPLKITFVCDNMPLSANYNGAASFKYAHLQLLASALPSAELSILVLDYDPDCVFEYNELQQAFPGRKFTVEVLNLRAKPNSPTKRKLALGAPGADKLQFFHSFISKVNIEEFHKLLKKLNPDLIWTEHLVQNYFAVKAQTSIPIIYCHVDFLWKTTQIKFERNVSGRLSRYKKYLLNWFFKTAEMALLRSNEHIVCGSVTEIEELRKVNPKARFEFFPTTYQSVASPEKQGKVGEVRLVHLGTMQAVANKIGLERFLLVCWPELQKLANPPKLQVIGDLKWAHKDLLNLLNHPNIECLGFVKNLSSVLRPYDVHLIPYERNTGTRTRVPLAMNYNQLVISTKAASSGLTGLENLRNVILTEDLAEMTQQIIRVLNGNIALQQIADNGKALFEQLFTVQGQKQKMVDFIKNVPTDRSDKVLV